MCGRIVPFPFTVMAGRDPDEDVEEDDARATSSSVGVGEAKTDPAAANAATTVKDFMMRDVSDNRV